MIIIVIYKITCNVNNKVYLSGQKNASSTSEPVLTTNYITFDIKKLQEFLGIADSQLHVKMSFEEVTEAGKVLTPIYDYNTVFDADGNNEIHFKTMSYEDPQNPVNVGIKTTNPDIGELVEKKPYVNSSSFTVKVRRYSGDVSHYAYEINNGVL